MISARSDTQHHLVFTEVPTAMRFLNEGVAMAPDELDLGDVELPFILGGWRSTRRMLRPILKLIIGHWILGGVQKNTF